MKKTFWFDLKQPCMFACMRGRGGEGRYVTWHAGRPVLVTSALNIKQMLHWLMRTVHLYRPGGIRAGVLDDMQDSAPKS